MTGVFRGCNISIPGEQCQQNPSVIRNLLVLLRSGQIDNNFTTVRGTVCKCKLEICNVARFDMTYISDAVTADVEVTSDVMQMVTTGTVGPGSSRNAIAEHYNMFIISTVYAVCYVMVN